jgi:tetratricopeptide (TPR) repeat protein
VLSSPKALVRGAEVALVASPPLVPGSLAFVHREIVQLLGLIALVVLAFFATRAIARTEQGLVLREAAEWYREGERQLEAGRPAAAVDALQRAAVRNRGEKLYALALARAMALAGDRTAARTTLLALREAAPEDIEINVQLARLEAADGDLAEALRYYRNALYAPWPAERADERRQLRVELIRFLLAQRAERTALTELTALQANLPDDPAAHVLAAQLFSEAGSRPSISATIARRPPIWIARPPIGRGSARRGSSRT